MVIENCERVGVLIAKYLKGKYEAKLETQGGGGGGGGRDTSQITILDRGIDFCLNHTFFHTNHLLLE